MRTGIRALLTIAVAACCLIGTRGGAAADPPPASIGFAAGASVTVTAPGAAGITVELPITVGNGTGSDTDTWSTDDGSQSGTVDDSTTQIPVDVSGTGAQTITVTLSGDTIDPANATATITVNAAPTATVADGTFDGEPTDTDVTLPVSLSAAPSTDVTVHYDTTQASAKLGVDYALPGLDADGNGSVAIAAGSTTVDIPITVKAATSGGTFSITLTGVDGGAVLGSSGTTATLTINPAPLPVLSVADTTVAAKANLDTTLDLPVTLSQAAATPVTVAYTTHFGTALLGQDYNVVDGTLTIPAGATSAAISIRIMAGSEGGDFSLTIQSPSSNAALDPDHSTATITITAAPLPQPTISLGSTTVAAGATDSTATIPVNLSVAAPTDVTVDYKATSGTAIDNVDYTLPSGTLYIAAGQKSTTIPFTVKGGSLGGVFTVALSNATNAVIDSAGGSTSVTISAAGTSPAALPTISTADLAVAAGSADTAGALVVELSAKAATDVTVAYAAIDGSAKSGTDYTLAAGTLTIPAGQPSASIPFTVKAGTNGGTFTVVLSEPSANAALDPVAHTATVTIVTGAALSIADVSVPEKGAATVTVTLVGAPAGVVTVAYGTADGTATAPSDYTKTSGVLTFAAGETTEAITIPIATDSRLEGSETFVVELSDPTNAILARAQARVTILDASAAASSGSGPVGFGGQNTGGLTVPRARGTGSLTGISGGGPSGGSSGSGPHSSGGSSNKPAGSNASGDQSQTGGSNSKSRSSVSHVTMSSLSSWLTTSHQLRVRLGCPKAARARCSGTITAAAKNKGRNVTLGSSRIRIARGHTAVSRIKINAAGMALLRRARTLKATLVVELSKNAGVALRWTGAVTLRAGAPPRTSVTITP